MPTTRKRTARPFSQRINREAVAAFRAGDSKRLAEALRLRPWAVCPLQAVGTCPDMPGTAWASTWADAVALRKELEHAD